MEKDNISLTILIPHVSVLLIYKDNQNNSTVMRHVIAELLRTDSYKDLYSGNKIEFQCSHYLLGFEDCAIVSLKLSGLQNLNSDEKDPALIFASVLQNKKNVLNFDHSILSETNKVSFIEIGIKIAKTLEKEQAETQAA